MKILQATFLEPVESPVAGRGGGMIEKYRDDPKNPGPMTCRAQGPGLLLEVKESPRVCIVPWGNVRFVLGEIEESDAKPAKQK